MYTTSTSLLGRLRQPGEQEAWVRFVKLYTPLLYSWARRVGLQPEDAADLVQDVLTTLVRKMPEFTYDRDKSFRNWLRTVTLNKWRENWRRHRGAVRQESAVGLSNLADPESIDVLEEAEYQHYLARRALRLMQTEFEPTTWKACWEQVVSGRSGAEVAAELGISEGAAYVGKCRVLRRLREELDGLLD
jgi:RNA polymerase sigma-70 factor (ECF subfamily)